MAWTFHLLDGSGIQITNEHVIKSHYLRLNTATYGLPNMDISLFYNAELSENLNQLTQSQNIRSFSIVLTDQATASSLTFTNAILTSLTWEYDNEALVYETSWIYSEARVGTNRTRNKTRKQETQKLDWKLVGF